MNASFSLNMPRPHSKSFAMQSLSLSSESLLSSGQAALDDEGSSLIIESDLESQMAQTRIDLRATQLHMERSLLLRLPGQAKAAVRRGLQLTSDHVHRNGHIYCSLIIGGTVVGGVVFIVVMGFIDAFASRSHEAAGSAPSNGTAIASQAAATFLVRGRY